MVGEGPEKGWAGNEILDSESFYFRPNDLRDPVAFTFPDDLSLCELSASGLPDVTAICDFSASSFSDDSALCDLLASAFSDQSALRVLRAFVVNSPDYLN